MRLLIDTHVFLWWDTEPDRLSQVASDLLRDRTNELLFSIASAWEMQIKLGTGKLQLRLPISDLIEEQQRDNGFNCSPFSWITSSRSSTCRRITGTPSTGC